MNFVYLKEEEKVEIQPWHKGYNEKPIDFRNRVEVCEWCRQMHKYRAEKNRVSVIDRFTIGFYQLGYIPPLLNNYNHYEFCEAVASAFIHIVASVENCGISCCYSVNMLVEPKGSSTVIYNNLLSDLPLLARQIYYYGKKRENRYNKNDLEKLSSVIIRQLIKLNNSKNIKLHFSESLMLAIAKVDALEFKTH